MADFEALFGKTLVSEGKEIESKSLNGKEAVLIYFSAHWCGPCRKFTPSLINTYNKLKEEGKDFEIVFVSSDKDKEAFDEYYGTMPIAALPFSERETKAELSRKYKVRGIPSLVILDGKTGKIITKDGRGAVAGDPLCENFPWAPPDFAEAFGDKFESDGKELSRDHFKGKIVALYFSAHWCPPCKKFTPILIKCYNALKEAGKNFEVCFVSSDKDEETFKQYFGTMPWTAIPYSEEKRRKVMSERFGVEGIPSLVIVDGTTGQTICADARENVNMDPTGKYFPWSVSVLTGGKAASLNETPGLIAFLPEDVSPEQEEKVREALLPEAANSSGGEGDDETGINFFLAKGDPVVAQVKHLMEMGGKGSHGTTVLAVLDIPQDGSFHSEVKDIGDLTSETVCKFINEFKAGKVRKVPLHTHSHSHGGGPSHGAH